MTGLYDDFPGHRSLTSEDLQTALKLGTVILDTNVLLELYAFEQPARESAFTLLESLGGRLFVPHQVLREFWRNRARKITDSRPKSLGVDQLQQTINQILNGLIPDRVRQSNLELVRHEIKEHLNAVETALRNVRGVPLNADESLADTNVDPVLKGLENLLKGRVGKPWSADVEIQHVTEGLRRFASQIPPGYEDADKLGQSEKGTGDYLVWRQSLEYVSSLGAEVRFVLVTSDSKKDWRLQHPSTARPLGVRPELVEEALRETGVGFALLTPETFYRLLGPIANFDTDRTETLVAASSQAASETSEDRTKWSEGAFVRLVTGLAAAGHVEQAELIGMAARAGGSLAIEEVAAIVEASVHDDLNAFVGAIKREHVDLVVRKAISAAAPAALSALLDGEGNHVEVRVPNEFVDYQTRMDLTSASTWVDQAELVMLADSERWWTPNELVAEIGRLGLRDLKKAATPAKTLRRDLAIRAPGRFEMGVQGFKIKRPAR